MLYPGALCYEVFTNIEVASNSGFVSTDFSTALLNNYHYYHLGLEGILRLGLLVLRPSLTLVGRLM